MAAASYVNHWNNPVFESRWNYWDATNDGWPLARIDYSLAFPKWSITTDSISWSLKYRDVRLEIMLMNQNFWQRRRMHPRKCQSHIHLLTRWCGHSQISWMCGLFLMRSAKCIGISMNMSSMQEPVLLNKPAKCALQGNCCSKVTWSHKSLNISRLNVQSP